jgi:hypothetical protein
MNELDAGQCLGKMGTGSAVIIWDEWGSSQRDDSCSRYHAHAPVIFKVIEMSYSCPSTVGAPPTTNLGKDSWCGVSSPTR